MKRLIAWDTSSKEGAIVALSWDESAGASSIRLVSEWGLSVEMTHSERLLWGIHQVLQSARWELDEVDYFGVGIGPGSFTGLRIGVTTARTLASTLKKPLIGVSSLSALSRPVAIWLAQQKAKATVIATTDACKGELFAMWGAAKSMLDCVVKAEGDLPGIWKRGVEEEVITPPVLMKAVKKKLGSTESWIAIGEGRARYLEDWAALPIKREIVPPVPFSNQVQGRYLGQLCWEGIQAGLSRPALLIHPRYLRASDAEMKLKAGLLKKAVVSQ